MAHIRKRVTCEHKPRADIILPRWLLCSPTFLERGLGTRRSGEGLVAGGRLSGTGGDVVVVAAAAAVAAGDGGGGAGEEAHGYEHRLKE